MMEKPFMHLGMNMVGVIALYGGCWSISIGDGAIRSKACP